MVKSKVRYIVSDCSMPFVSVFPTKGLQYTKLSPVWIFSFYFLEIIFVVGSAATFIVSTLISKVPSSEFVLLSRIFISGKELMVRS